MSWLQRKIDPEDIKAIFESTGEPKAESFVAIPERQQNDSWSQNRPRRWSNNYHNSLFGIMTAAHKGENDLLFSVNMNNIAKNGMKSRIFPTRVTISFPRKGEVFGKLPGSFKELLEIGAKKFGVFPAKVVCKDGAEIDDIEVIRDGDHLVFVSVGRVLETKCPQ
ncbi:KHA domain [Sesbania bispinosa]|nr:KHA domain [Sesbania bispinosa]